MIGSGVRGFMSPQWTYSEFRAYGFGLDFRVRNHISDKYGRILFGLGAKTTHDGLHMHVMYFSTSDPRWPTSGHFSCKKKQQQKNPVSNTSSTIYQTRIYRRYSNLGHR